jgi:cytochrome P450
VQTGQFLHDMEAFLQSNWRRHGDVFQARIHGFATGRLVFVSDPALVEQVFKASPYAARAGEAAQRAIEPVAGMSSLLGLDAPRHLEHRRMMLPPFHGDRLGGYEAVMREETARSIEQWPLGEPFAMRERMTGITLEVIMRAVFGLERGPRYEAVRRAFSTMMDNNFTFSVALLVPVFRRNLGPWHAWGDFEAARDEAYSLIRAEIGERRLAADVDERADILSMLIAGRDKEGEGLTDDELIDELMTLLGAGHETTSTALTWTFELLHRNPRVLRCLQESLAGDDDAYLDALISEVLRIRPVVSFVLRVLHEPLRLGDYELEPGMTVAPCVTLLHRRPDLYPEPDEFRPERFLERTPGTYEWIAFGGGTRRCLGASFARMEMKVIIREVLANSRLEPAAPKPEKIVRRAIFAVPEHGSMTIRRPIAVGS